MMILGLYFNSGKSSLTLLENGKIIFSIREEVLSRKQGDDSFPELALMEVLKRQQLVIEQIDHIVVSFKPIRRFESFIFNELAHWPKKIIGFPNRLNTLLLNQFNLLKKIQSFIGHKKDIMFIDTSLSLAATCYYCNPNEEPIIISNEKNSLAYYFKKEQINILKINSTANSQNLPEELASLGAACLVWEKLNPKNSLIIEQDFCYGPVYEQEEIERYLESLNIPWTPLSIFPFEKEINEGKSIGVFKGKLSLSHACIKGRYIHNKQGLKPLQPPDEPIACSFQDAWRSFLLTDIDYLALENCVINKSEIKRRQKIGL